ncbi:sex comb on midleg-like protein 1 [Peromyscus leucopus]|uniref:sex comb on midleg-like protein 1 n=1 Tax=Peromyscus leucopus TaxID=10041 RepID=UPI0010A12DA4|nr:sex comb on midleg-like protein 1 [Peromyscus leucopus]
MMSAFREIDEKGTYSPEICEVEDPKATVDILNYCQVIYKTVQRLEKKFDDLDEKVTKIYHSRARSFWRYPPFRAVSRRYNYLMSRRHKLQKARRFINDNLISRPHSYSPTTVVFERNEDSEDMENNQTVDYLQAFQYPNSIDNTETFQYADYIDNNQALHYSDDLYNTQSSKYANSIDSSIQNNEDNDVFHSEDSQEVILVSSSPERDYEETPPSPTSTGQTYQQYYRFKNNPSSSSVPYYSDFENTNVDTITSTTSTVKEASTLPPGELIPIQNPEMRRLALLEAQRSPVIDPNTFGSSSECNDAVVRHLGSPANWSVNDVITFLNRLDPPLADQLYPIIREHAIDGKALLLLDFDVMVKYMGMKVGVVMKFSSYIQKLKEGVKCDE